MQRSSGILLSISSLPSPYGIGTFGKVAYDFVDFLYASGQKYWQMLPLGPTSFGDSPYQSFSTFAGNPYFIDLDMLVEDGLISKKDLKNIDWGKDETSVDYGKIYENRFAVLEKAKKNGWERDKEDVKRFTAEKSWLKDYALFMACKRHFDMKSWLEWPDESLRKRQHDTLIDYSERLKDDIELFTYIQYLFYKQWEKLREYIRAKDIKIIGDVPIYVALDSADVWSEPHEFMLDEDFKPIDVSGCPPDAFSKNGQLWGNPLYDWEHMENDGFGWWIRRIEGLSGLYDVIRIDHFRGLDEYWAVPYGEKTAKNGEWRRGPGMKLVRVLNGWFENVKFIAEDLGFASDSVEQLLKDSGWPGMKVMEFAFDSQSASAYLPHRYNNNCICYTGTHDNETIMEWKENISKKDLAYAIEYLNLTEDEGYNFGMIRGGMSSVADLFITQMQDYLGLGKGSRMNTPSTTGTNWQWRMKASDLKGPAAKKLAARIKKMTTIYGRG